MKYKLDIRGRPLSFLLSHKSICLHYSTYVEYPYGDLSSGVRASCLGMAVRHVPPRIGRGLLLYHWHSVPGNRSQ